VARRHFGDGSTGAWRAGPSSGKGSEAALGRQVVSRLNGRGGASVRPRPGPVSRPRAAEWPCSDRRCPAALARWRQAASRAPRPGLRPHRIPDQGNAALASICARLSLARRLWSSNAGRPPGPGAIPSWPRGRAGGQFELTFLALKPLPKRRWPSSRPGFGGSLLPSTWGAGGSALPTWRNSVAYSNRQKPALLALCARRPGGGGEGHPLPTRFQRRSDSLRASSTDAHVRPAPTAGG